MSLLVELLSKLKRDRKGKAISPMIEQVAKKRRGSRVFYLAVVLMAVLSIASGFMLVSILQSRKSTTLRVERAEKEKSEMEPAPVIKKKTESEKVVVSQVKPSESKSETKKAEPINSEAERPLEQDKGKTSSPVAAKEKAETKKPEPKKPTSSVAKENTGVKPPPVTKKRENAVDYFLYSALKAERKGRYKEAFQGYSKALQIRQKDALILNKLSYLSLKLGDIQAAINYANRALRIEPDSVEAMLNLSVALFRAGRIDEAEEWLDRAYRLSPEDERVIYNLAVFHERKGELERAEALYRELFSRGLLRGILGLARIEERRGNSKKALEYYSLALKHRGIKTGTRRFIEGRVSALSQRAH